MTVASVVPLSRTLWLGCTSAGVIALVAKILSKWRQARRMEKMLKTVPYADCPSDGIAGFVTDFMKNRRRKNDWFLDIMKGRGVVRVRGLIFDPNSHMVLATDPAFVKHILKDRFEIYSKPHGRDSVWWTFIGQWIGRGIFTIQHGEGADDKGDMWHKQRKIAANIFSKGNFQTNMHEVFVSKGKRLCDALVAPAKAGGRADIQKMMFQFTMDSIMEIFFGHLIDTVGGEYCAYGSSFDEAHRQMVEYVQPNWSTLEVMALLPWPMGGYDGLAQQVHSAFSAPFQRFKKACKVLNAESARLVSECRSDPGLANRKDLLALFVQAETTERFTTDYLRDMTMNFVLAGRDTTACALSWAMLILTTNPEVQAKLIEEVDRVLPNGTEPTLKLLSSNSMPYLHGVLYETFRLYPPVPNDQKYATADDVTQDGMQIPKGTVVVFLPYVSGRDPVRYPNPEEVRPERWIPFKAPPPHEFPVFQAGPRICLGMDMAIFEAKVVIVMLLQRFSFELLAGEREKIVPGSGLTMGICNSPEQDSHELWVVPKLREEP